MLVSLFGTLLDLVDGKEETLAEGTLVVLPCWRLGSSLAVATVGGERLGEMLFQLGRDDGAIVNAISLLGCDDGSFLSKMLCPLCLDGANEVVDNVIGPIEGIRFSGLDGCELDEVVSTGTIIVGDQLGGESDGM